MNNRHCFNFEGGEDLTTMGASWFVSYAYYCNVDSSHQNWKIVSTVSNRMSVYARTAEYHEFWLNEILKMEDKRLNKNSIDLEASEIKLMAEKLLNKKTTFILHKK